MKRGQIIGWTAAVVMMGSIATHVGHQIILENQEADKAAAEANLAQQLLLGQIKKQWVEDQKSALKWAQKLATYAHLPADIITTHDTVAARYDEDARIYAVTAMFNPTDYITCGVEKDGNGKVVANSVDNEISWYLDLKKLPSFSSPLDWNSLQHLTLYSDPPMLQEKMFFDPGTRYRASPSIIAEQVSFSGKTGVSQYSDFSDNVPSDRPDLLKSGFVTTQFIQQQRQSLGLICNKIIGQINNGGLPAHKFPGVHFDIVPNDIAIQNPVRNKATLANRVYEFNKHRDPR